MRTLNQHELNTISGGKPKFLNVIGGSLFTGIIEGFLGFCAAGPPGAVVGLGHGLFDGTAGALAIEGGLALAEMHSPN